MKKTNTKDKKLKRNSVVLDVLDKILNSGLNINVKYSPDKNIDVTVGTKSKSDEHQSQ